MLRVQQMGDKAYAVDIGDDITDEQVEAIKSLVKDGIPVVICDLIDDIIDNDIFRDIEIEIVKDE